MAKIIKSKTLRVEQGRLVAGTKAYIKLKKQVTAAGILQRSYGYYACLIFIVFAGLVSTAYVLWQSNTLFSIFLFSILLAIFAVQIGGLMHDAGHRAMFQSTIANDIWGYIFSSIDAMSFSQWKTKHNKHHARPNQEGEDPDVNLPLLSFTKERFEAKKGIARLLRKYQVFIYFPLATLVIFSTRIGSLFYFKREFQIMMIWEIALFCIGFFIWFVLPFLVFDLEKALFVFAVFNMTAGLYMFNVFAPNHKGMPHITKSAKLSFLEQQVITSRNVTGSWLNDAVYMGLNYQIEHHLFPDCPRNKLKLITPFVKDVCKEMGLPYSTVSPMKSNIIILTELNQVATTSS